MYHKMIAGVLLLFMTACQTTIPLDDLRKKKKSVSTQKLTLSQAIAEGNLEQADTLYLDFRGEYPESDRIPNLMLKLSQAHIDQKEYLLARYYAESYISDYPDGKRVDLAWFLRLKSLFSHLTAKGSGEVQQGHFEEEIKAFMANPVYRKYHAKADSLLKKYQEIRRQHNEELALYYEKLGKEKAAAFYREKSKALEKSRQKE